MDACGESWTGQRNRALITVLWRAGLRLGEALALRQIDIGWTAQTIRVLHGKGDRARTVGLDKRAIRVLSDWAHIRNGDEWGPMLCTRDFKPLKQSYVRALLPRLARKAGVRKRVHAHGFRHSFAVGLAQEHVSMVNIQRLLGHASLGTTSVYLTSLSPEEALDAVRGREW